MKGDVSMAAGKRKTAPGIHDGSDYSPHEGLAVTGRPTTVILGSPVMVEDGALLGQKGAGKYKPRELLLSLLCL